MSSADDLECSQRRSDEFEFIRAAFDASEARVDEEAREVVRRLQLTLPAVAVPVSDHSTAECNGDIVIELVVRMPPGYPMQEGACLSIDGNMLALPSTPSYVRKAGCDALSKIVAQCESSARQIAECGGGEAVFAVLSVADEWVQSEWEAALRSFQMDASSDEQNGVRDDRRDGNNCSQDSLQRNAKKMDASAASGDKTRPSSSVYGVMVHVDHMNNGRSYRKWLIRTCESQQCALIIRQFRFDAKDGGSGGGGKPQIYVFILGEKERVRSAMKLWRISKVDVNKKGKPCIERKMVVVAEGGGLSVPGNASNDESGIDCSMKELATLVERMSVDWLGKLQDSWSWASETSSNYKR